MNEQTVNTYTVDDIHNMRVAFAEQCKRMTPAEAERIFKAHVESAKKTIEALREERRLAAIYAQTKNLR